MNLFKRHRENKMSIEDKIYAETALKKMFIGSVVDGIKFECGPGSTLVFFMHYTQNPLDFDFIWLNIENSKWAVYDCEDKIPNSLEDIDRLTEEEGYCCIFNIRREEVIDIRLGDISPHLYITLKSGKVLFVGGYHEKYESWQASNGIHESGEWLIVAVPENRIASWTPETRKGWLR
jgi:hypothetical protein